MPSRRCILTTALAGTSLIATGREICAATDPIAPWAAARESATNDWRVDALRWAVLAPNPHNRQPWLASLASDDAMLVRCDLDRRLPETDPYDRQITIGLGAFCELFRMAAAEQGIVVAIDPFPAGESADLGRLDGRPVARLRRVPGLAKADPLFAHATERRSAKRPYDMTRLPASNALARIATTAGGPVAFVTEPDALQRLRALVWAAWQTELRTPAAHLETVNLMRLGSAAVAAQPDGVSVAGPGLDDMVAQGILTRDAFVAPGRPGYDAMVARYAPMLAATPAYVYTTGATAGRAAHLAAGAQWLRINLAATAAGLAVQPVSQALQEYPEMAGHFATIHRSLSISIPERLHMLARIGHLPPGEQAPRTPRWAAETRLLA